MGRITDILKLILMRRRSKKSKTKVITVYSEDTCRIDQDGGPYIVKIYEEESNGICKER